MHTERQNGLNEIERTLASLVPSASDLDRDALMFRAGQQAAPRRSGAFWPAAACVMTLVSVVLGVALQMQPTPAPGSGVVHVDPPKTSDAPLPDFEFAALPDNSYFRLRALVLAEGVDALPEPKPGKAPPPLDINELL